MVRWSRSNAFPRARAPIEATTFARRFAGDRSGAAALEFAIVATPFFGFVLFILQIALFHFSQQSLDHVTRLAARQIMTGTLPSGAKTLSGFKTNVICPKVLFKLTCADVVVNAYKVAKTSSAKDSTGIYKFVDEKTKTLYGPVTDPKQNTFCLGGPGDYIFLDIAYSFPDISGGILSSAGSKLFLRSSTFIFNEPTIAAGASC